MHQGTMGDGTGTGIGVFSAVTRSAISHTFLLAKADKEKEKDEEDFQDTILELTLFIFLAISISCQKLIRSPAKRRERRKKRISVRKWSEFQSLHRTGTKKWKKEENDYCLSSLTLTFCNGVRTCTHPRHNQFVHVEQVPRTQRHFLQAIQNKSNPS